MLKQKRIRVDILTVVYVCTLVICRTANDYSVIVHAVRQTALALIA